MKNLKKLKLYLLRNVYVITEKYNIWVISHMKPGKKKRELLCKLVEGNSRVTQCKDNPSWLRKEILKMDIKLLAITNDDNKYWNKKLDNIKNRSKEEES